MIQEPSRRNIIIEHEQCVFSLIDTLYLLFALAAALFALISLDGESTWLEGLLLCAFYLILAVSTFFAPIA
jgi:Ca2+:H+ antiporter